MRITKVILIFAMLAVMMPFAAQPVLADSACAVPEVEVCLFSQLDHKAPGTRVFCTLAAYYEPVDTANQIIPGTCRNGPCVPSKKVSCPALCIDPQAYLMVFIRAHYQKDIKHFMMAVDTASLTPVDGVDPCDEFTEAVKCKCRRDFAIANGLDKVPLCTVTDQAFQEEYFLKFIQANLIPAFFPDSPDAPFAVKSVSDYAINDDVEPFYGILDFVLAVQK